MASLSRRDPEFDADLWADLAARLLGVLAAFGLAALGLFLLFPAAGAGHLPPLPLGPAEPERPLIGLLCFALAGIIATTVLLFRMPEPVARQPKRREVGLAPAGPIEPPVLAPFPAAQPWRAPEPPNPDPTAIAMTDGASTVTSPEAVTPQPDPEIPPPDGQSEARVSQIPAPEQAVATDVPASPDPAPLQLIEAQIEQPEPEPNAAEVQLEPVMDAGAAAMQASLDPVPAPVDEEFDARRQKLRATLAEASALAAALSAQAKGDHQHALAAQDVGDAALASGAPDRAADAYDRALTHARTLMEAHPSAPAVRTVLAEVLAKIGDLNAAKGRMGAAMGAYEEAIVHRREAAHLSGSDIDRLNLAAALERLAQLRQARGDTGKARALLTESLDHLAPLAAADPRHGDMAYRAKLSLLALDRDGLDGLS